MRILILGSGGREHAIYLKLSESDKVEKLFFAPGNAGVGSENRLQLDMSDFEAVAAAVSGHEIDMVVVGPEAPLAAGLVDYLNEKTPGVYVFGPDKNGARLEASKAFAAEFMKKAGIPAAISTEAVSFDEALKVLAGHSLPVVIKADGLAAGKGVSIHRDKKEAEAKLNEIFNEDIFGEAGSRVLFQTFLEGTEASLFAICNSTEAIVMPTARDYKPVFEKGQGPNTGGMGSACPGDALNDSHIAFIQSRIIEPVLREFKYRGVLYIGLMIHSEKGDDLSVVEFNCRFGDPETQSILPMLEEDLLPYLLWSAGKELPAARVKKEGYEQVPVKPGVSVNTVLTAAGYPGSYAKGLSLRLPEKLPENVHIVHAGTAEKDGRLVSAGGRILNVVALSDSFENARKNIYAVLDDFIAANEPDSFHFRRDIAEFS